ncbi:MAG: thioredoxin domain-containing protein, partial [bacterium]
RDDKILTDWNGLAIAALAKAGRALDEARYSEAARRAADFVLGRLRDDRGRLLHVWNAGEAKLAGNLDDHAFLVWGLIEVYQATFEARYLRAALEICRLMIAHFGDPAGAGYYFAADDGESLLVRQKQIYDGAIPSGNSVALSNLLRLARLTGDQGLEREAARQAAWLGRRAGRAPLAHVHALSGLDLAAGPSQEVVIAGAERGDDTRAMLRALSSRFLPRAVAILVPTDQPEPEITRLAPFVESYGSLQGRAAAYVCRDFTCALPTAEPERMLEQLER